MRYPILILLLPVFHICIGNNDTTWFGLGNGTSLPNSASGGNKTVLFSPQIIVFMPDALIEDQPNDLTRFGNLIRNFFKEPISPVTSLPNTSATADSIKNRRDLQEIWNAAFNASHAAYNTTKNVYHKAADGIRKLAVRSASLQHNCSKATCKTHAKSTRKVSETTTAKTTKLDLINDELFEFTTTSKAEVTTNNTAEESTISQKNITVPGNHGKRSQTSVDPSSKTSTASIVNNTNPDLYGNWLLHHIQSFNNATLNSTHFIKRRYFLFNSGGTGKSTTAKISELFADEAPAENKLRQKRAQKFSSDVVENEYFGKYFEKRFLNSVKEEGAEKYDDHVNVDVEREYNEGGHQPTKPLLLFVTIPSLVGMVVFVLALCFLTRTGGWCCRLFDPPHRSVRSQLPKANSDSVQSTSA